MNLLISLRDTEDISFFSLMKLCASKINFLANSWIVSKSFSFKLPLFWLNILWSGSKIIFSIYLFSSSLVKFPKSNTKLSNECGKGFTVYTKELSDAFFNFSISVVFTFLFFLKVFATSRPSEIFFPCLYGLHAAINTIFEGKGFPWHVCLHINSLIKPIDLHVFISSKNTHNFLGI